jgi:hypothetical protein
MAEQPYKRPPITEAVIALTFAEPVEARDLEKADSNFARLYPLEQVARNVAVHIEPDRTIRKEALRCFMWVARVPAFRQ